MSQSQPASKEELKDFCLDNKYSRWYFNIITNAISEVRNKKQEIYYENHHILPKSIVKNNVTVLLTAREHYVCHLLLPKMLSEFKHRQKMLFALYKLIHGNKKEYIKSSYVYEMIKIEHSKACSIRSKSLWKDQSYITNMKEIRKNIVLSESEVERRRRQCSEMIKNRPDQSGDNHPLRKKGGHSEETKIRMSEEFIRSGRNKGKNNPMYGKPGASTGKKWYHNPNTKEEKYYQIGSEDTGFILGRLKHVAIATC